MFLKCRILLRSILFQIIYCFYYFFSFKKNIVLIIHSDASTLYSNLREIERYFNNHNIQYKTIFNNKNIKNIHLIAKSSIIIIDQSNYFLSYIRLFSSTKVLQLWHGGGLYKKVAFDKISSKKSIKKITRIYRNISFLNISDVKLIDNYSHMFNIYKKNIISYGLPRTDLLFIRNTFDDKKKFLLMYPEIGNKKICLYAPTFRESDVKKRKSLDFDLKEVNKQLQDHIIIYRAHPTLKVSKNTGDIIDVSDLELDFVLSVSDILISDYSSIIFDYSFFKRPIVLFVPDLEEYFIKNKQLYYHPSDLVGYNNVCYNGQDLVKVVEKAVYKIDLWNLFMSSCQGDSCEKLASFIKDLQIKGDI
ncbi:CDP-glycerol glycerophosphotransferase family protein [Campylobacter insulaenigrae]|uniref:CDP-glycerol glycerophosphotransferase family protein n=1 Tax=Campylobacter insulaenigrae TaxID=260714 RepID=UPI0021520EA5|nr:CDP-glycerol glycerophosphotransferase family protein [Campylobacter insulaenigrae]MCR6585064.1 CDP-glycerol glycerophosphotransferase family protein [Campylobacter insulaenigrae]